MIDFYSALMSIVVLYGISLSTGYAIAHYIFDAKLSSYPFFVRLPVYIAFGFSMLIPVYLAMAVVKVTVLTSLMVFLLSTAYIVLGRKTWCRRNKQCDNQRQSKFSAHGLFENTFPFIFFVATLMYFSLIVGYMKWPPAGDIISGTGPLVSLIEFTGKLPIGQSPILVLYPPGFHVATATFNTLLRLYPAEAVFLIGASVIILIPQLLYSLTYFTTNSKIFSLIAFSSGLLIHPSGHLEKWVVGYFFNGVYPCLTGFLIIMTFANFLVLISIDNDERNWYKVRNNLMISFLLNVSLVFTYPPFALLTITYTVMMLIIHRDLIWQQFKLVSVNLTTKILIAIAIILVLAFLYSLISQNHYIFNLLISYLRGSYFPGGVGIGGKETAYAYVISPSFFLDNVNGISIIIAYLIGAYLIMKWKKLDVPLFFMVIATFVFVSLNEIIYQYVFYILPSRSIIILSLLSYQLIFTAVDKILKRLSYANKVIIIVIKRKITIKFHEVMLKGAIAIIVISIFAPSLSGYFSFEKLQEWSWFSCQPWFMNDLAALEWINKNIGSTDLILNDASYISNYLWSLSIKNLTSHPWSQCVYKERFNVLQKVWQNPRDIQYIIEILKKYNISYIFSTSEWGYLLSGEHHGYYAKSYTPEQYAKIFDHYFFLKPVFTSGSTRVYKVSLTDVKLKQLQIYDLQSSTANTFWNESGAWNAGGTVGIPLLSNVTQKIDVPSGNFYCWGVYHYFQGIEKWPEKTRYLSISIRTRFRLGLSLLVWDINGNNVRYDFVSSGENNDRIFLDLLNPSESHGIIDIKKIRGFALITGFVGPYPRPGDSIWIKYIALYEVD